MIILSAFRYEIIHDDGNYDIDDNGNSNEDSGTTVDKTVLDALSKFDRNVIQFKSNVLFHIINLINFLG